MASKPVAQLNGAEKEQLAVSYAAFVLSGQGAQVTADTINAVLTAAGLTANANLVKAFAKTLGTRNVSDFLGSIGGSTGGSAPTETKAEEKKNDAPKDNKDAKGAKNAPPPPPPQQEEEMDMGGLFD